MKNSSGKPRIVIDTTVWISGIVFDGNCRRILQLFADDEIVIVVSEELLSELRRKILQRFPKFIDRLSSLELSIREDGETFPLGRAQVKISRDPDDDKFIETALVGGADYIVSGDQDLLEVKVYEGIPILTSVEFLQQRQV